MINLLTPEDDVMSPLAAVSLPSGETGKEQNTTLQWESIIQMGEGKGPGELPRRVSTPAQTLPSDFREGCPGALG